MISQANDPMDDTATASLGEAPGTTACEDAESWSSYLNPLGLWRHLYNGASADQESWRLNHSDGGGRSDLSNSNVGYGSTDKVDEEECFFDAIDASDDDTSNDDSSTPDMLRDELLQKTLEFDLPVNPEKGYRATKLSLCSFARPHMRAFHGSWMCFCCAWLLWFSTAPLLPIMSANSIPMTKADMWTSNLFALIGTIFVRIVLGPLCDQYGGKDILTGLLVLCAIPCGLGGLLIHGYASLVVVRSLVGCVGGTLVPAQFWVSSHFAPECAGVAMATAGGWGALGGGIAQAFMGSFLMPLLHHLFNGNDELAWRVAMTVPAAIALCTALFYYNNADDCPLGNYKEVRAAGLLQLRSAVDSFRQGIFNLNAWILFVQFGASLGIELVMESGMTLHLSERFDLSLESAAGMASLYGLMNLFARGFGGYLSDKLHKFYSLQGRLFAQMVLLALEGLLILGFIQSDNSLTAALFWMVAFAATGQMAMGTCFGIVPYIDPRCTGMIAGIVAAGGNLGGVFISNVFRTSDSETEPFRVMSYFCFFAAILTPFIIVSGYRGIVWGSEPKTPPVTLLTPAGLKPGLR